MTFEATSRSKIEHYMGMHVLYDTQTPSHSRRATPRVWLHQSHGSGSKCRRWRQYTPDPHEVYSKVDSLPEIDIKLRDKVWQAHDKLIHLTIRARPDLVHAVPVLRGMYIIQARNYGIPILGSLSTWLRLETSDLPSKPQTSNVLISSSMVTPTPTGVALLTTENLQAPISSFG